MPVRGIAACAVPALFGCVLVAGCRSPRNEFASLDSRPAVTAAITAAQTGAPDSPVQRASFADSPPPVTPSLDDGHPGINSAPGSGELAIEPLVAEVLARNPSLEAMIFAWRAAAARYPQAISLDDPMFGFMIGPSALNHPSGSDGYMVEASQKLPWHGKRDLRGQQALAEASAACADITETRLRLIAATKSAVADYFLVHRLQELNRENARIMHEFRDTARVKYETNQVTQEDVLLADVELAELQRRTLELARMDRVAIARINTLLHLPPDTPLPPPPSQLDLVGSVPPVEELRGLALARRPELTAQMARIRAEQAALGLANLEYYPDLDLAARYDGFWEDPDLRPMVGMNLNVPIYHNKRDAAVREAAYRLNQRRAELQQRIDDVNNEVQAAYEQLSESQQTLVLYQTKILPAAKQNVDTARTTYTTAKLDFLRLVESQRRYLMLQEKQREAEAETLRRAAELERVAGGPFSQPDAADRPLSPQ